PVTLMSTGSLGAVGRAVAGGIPDARRFRMNVTVDGLPAWAEHDWAGRELALGPAVRLRVVDPVPRCVVTTRDPEDGSVDVPVLRTLAELRGKDDVTFGVWCEVVAPGRIRRGDEMIVSG
ncbi:MAG TPA: MOSC domain-containing protein, partial [Solirubrobacteraceae bacterium]|nr:MOSC domain-containing protein [Solirubrobacteraceae bacterium]